VHGFHLDEDYKFNVASRAANDSVFTTEDGFSSTYLKHMSQSGTWGDGVVLASAARLYVRPIVVSFPLNKPPVRFECDSVMSGSPIYLGLMNASGSIKPNDHYVSLVLSSTVQQSVANPAGDPDNVVVETPVTFALPTCPIVCVECDVVESEGIVNDVLTEKNCDIMSFTTSTHMVAEQSSASNTSTDIIGEQSSAIMSCEQENNVLENRTATGSSKDITSVCEYPFQPDVVVIVPQQLSTKKLYFQQTWFKQFPWLHYDSL